MRIPSKSVEGSLRSLQGTQAQCSRTSFVDTLTSVSSNAAQRRSTVHSKVQTEPRQHSDDSTKSNNQEQNRFSAQAGPKAIAAKSAQGSKVRASHSQLDSSEQSTSKDKGGIEQSSQSATDRTSQGTKSNKTMFTCQVAAPFDLQALTAQPDFSQVSNGLPVGSGTETAVCSGTALPGQSLEAHGATAVTSQVADVPTQAIAAETRAVQSALNSGFGQGSDGGQTPIVLQAARLAAEQGTRELSSIDSDASAVSQTADISQAVAAMAGNNSCITVPAVATVTMEASPIAKIQMGSGTKTVNGDPSKPTVKSIQSNDANSPFGLSADSEAIPAKPAKSADVGDARSSSHDADNGGAQTPISQSANRHGAVVAATGSEVIASHPIFAATPAGSRITTEGHSSNGSTETTAQAGSVLDAAASEQLHGGQSVGMSGISAARLIQTIGETEMHVGLHSSEFGDISIRTALSQQQMQTRISVDHNELGNALSAHIPSAEAKLGSELGLRATIEVNQNGSSFSSDGGRSHQQQQRTTVHSVETAEAQVALQGDTMHLRSTVVQNGEYRLDIRA